MLDDALSSTPGLTHLRFNRRRALFGRYDAIHFHWPETLLGGASAPKRVVKRLLFAMLLLRLRFSPIAVIRTVHNVELPRDVSGWERRMLEAIERRADFRILLNDSAPGAPGRHAIILHGDFVDWYRRHGAQNLSPVANTIGFVGLIRRYKGVEALIAAFGETTDPDLRLRISGNPTSTGLATEIREQSAGDDRIDHDLRFLAEREFATAINAAEGIVLPYRFMHNSGAALAALSLNRPILVPRNDVNESLSAEVGPGWVQMFDSDLTSLDLVGFLPSAHRDRSSDAPDLSARSWDQAGRRHLAAYRSAVALRRGGAS